MVDTVQRFFDAMADRDVKTSRQVLLPEGVFVSIRKEDGTRLLRHFTNAAYLERLATRTGDVLERMNDPIVLIEGDVATVWAEYEFLKDGKLSHTGFDAFNLIRTDDGWKITGGAYTVLPVQDN